MLSSGIDVPPILESLRRKELIFRKEGSALENANEYIFKHSLLRDVTYETVLLAERRQWHSETAHWLVATKGEPRNESLAEIAEHFEKAGEIENSAFWYGTAAEYARQSFALETAETYFVKAFEFLDLISKSDRISLLTTEQILNWKNSLGKVFSRASQISRSNRRFYRVA